jgi:hypothetical protein
MRFILIGFVTLFSYEAFSQTLEMHTSFGGAQFKLDTIYLTHRQVRQILSIDPRASREFKIAVNNSRFSGLAGFSGVIFLAPLITAVAGGNANWIMVGGGVVLLGASIPLSKAFKKHAQIAVDGYNQRQQMQGRAKLYFAGNGFKLKF